MLAYVNGKFVNKTPAKVIVDVNGVGYDVNISLNTYEVISTQESGLLYTHLQITENAHTLYGFANAKEKDIFLHLISISGIGASTARMMLSSMKPHEIAKFIVQGSVNDLVRIKGIGKKTAELLVVGLRDKLGNFLSESVSVQPFHTISPMATDAVEALIALGINKAMAEKAISKILASTENLAIQDIIKQALKNL
jgi:holliday junction DNA helicase RuvA